MNASVGIEIELSGRAAPGSGAPAAGPMVRGAWVRDARPAAASSQAQSGIATGSAAANVPVNGAESFQSRWQSMLAAIGADSAEGETEGARDAGTTETGIEARATASVLPLPALHAGADEVQPGAPAGGRNAAADAMGSRSSAGLNRWLPGANVGEPSDAKPGAAGTAKTASRPEGFDAGRKRARETSLPDSTAAAGPLAGLSPLAAVVSATPAPAKDIAEPAAAGEDTQFAGSAWSGLSQYASETSSPIALAAPQRGTAVHATPATETEKTAGTTARSAGAKPEAALRVSSGADAEEDAAIPQGQATAEAAVGSADGRILPADRAPGSNPDALVLPPASGGDVSRQDGFSAPTEASGAKGGSVHQVPQQTYTGAEPAQAPALAAAGTVAASGATGQPASVRGRRGNESGASAVHGGAVQTSGVPQASMLARNPAGAAGEARGLNGAPVAAGPPGMGARETFAALDAEPGAGAPSWIHAGAQRAEAGFEDPVLGWVGVRADLGAGGVHAAIVPGSAEAAQSLGGHLAGLNAHLAAEQIPVSSLSMAAATGKESAAQGAMQSAAGQQGYGQHGGGQDAERGSEQGPEQGNSSMSGAGTRSDGESVRGNASLSGNLPAPAGSTQTEPIFLGTAAKGTHISVLA